MRRTRAKFYCGIGGGAVPSAPVLTWTSATAAYNPTFALTGILVADVVQLQIDDDPAFGSTYGDDTNTVDSTEAADGQLTFSGIPTLGYATTYYARARITRGGATSAWSNSVSKTMDAAPATTWDPANKSSFITLSGANLIASGTNTVGAEQPVLGTTSKSSGKRYYEASFLNLVGDNAGAGVANTLPANFANPGNTPNAIHYCLNTGIVRYNNVTQATQATYNHASVPAIVMVAIDKGADKIWFGLNGTFVGNPGAGTGGYSISGIGAVFPEFSAWNINASTLKRKSSEFTYTPPSGFLGWDD